MRIKQIKKALLCIAIASQVSIFAGCGGHAVTPNTIQSAPKPHSSGPSHEKIDVAHQTRTVTIKRRGSWSLTSDKVQEIAPFVSRASLEYGLPEDIIYGIIWVESRFNPTAVSPVGAKGLMQLMPKTARYLAERIEWNKRVNAFKPEFNIHAGSYYIAHLIEQFDGDENLALAAYNAGPTRVRKWLKEGGLPKVAIEYATMVQTARTFFGTKAREGTPSDAERGPFITNHDLDRLGLAILIAGLSDKQFGLEREDNPAPFREP